MKIAASLLAVAALACGASGARAQAVPKEYAEMAAAMQAAQARAIRPGDEALPCAALEKELVSSMNDPAIQAYAGKSAAAAQKNATAAEKSKAPMTPQAAAALAASFGGVGGLPPGLAASPGLGAQAQAAQKLQAEQMKQMIPIMPQMMRSQRVMQLAAVKQCPWMVGAVQPGLNPYAPPPSFRK